MTSRHWLNTQMGLGHEGFNKYLEAFASDFRLSEHNHRRFYSHWAKVMGAERMSDLHAPASIDAA